MRPFIIFIFSIVIPLMAHADCTGPAGIAGTMNYFEAPENTYKFCNGTKWVRMGNEPSGIRNGWPDVIECLRNDNQGSNIFYIGNPKFANIVFYIEPAHQTTISFDNATQNFLTCNVIDTPGETGICSFLSTSDCLNTAQGIDRLRSLGRTFTFFRQ